MKKFILFTITIFVFQVSVAQTSVFDSSAYLDINQIKANIFTGGLNFFDTSSFQNYIYPADSQSGTIMSSALWIGGKKQGAIFLAAERYHSNGRDYYPGPVMDSASFQAEAANWNKVWKINKSAIDYHIAHWSDTGYVMPNSIAHWPVYANPSLNINHDLAPYVDTDGNGHYDPLNGDYPKIRGDQAIYFIYNDSVFKHAESGGKRIGVEVHAMAYAYNSNPLLNKTIFINYLIYNKSPKIYDSIYIGLFTDIDIGDATDDYIGCDTVLNTYFGYNADSCDGSIGNPHTYANNPPVQAISFCNQRMNSFAYYNNLGLHESMSDPDKASEYYLYLTSRWKDSTHFVYSGNGHYLYGGDSTRPVRYIFPGNPNDTAQWNERSGANTPYDRRAVGVTGPFQLIPGQYISLDVSYITVDSGSVATGFPNVENMYQTIPLICDFVSTNIPADGSDLALGTDNYNNYPDFNNYKVYPNPAHNYISLINQGGDATIIEISDINGKILQSKECTGRKTELDISSFRQGIYIVRINNGDKIKFTKFVKM